MPREDVTRPSSLMSVHIPEHTMFFPEPHSFLEINPTYSCVFTLCTDYPHWFLPFLRMELSFIRIFKLSPCSHWLELRSVLGLYTWQSFRSLEAYRIQFLLIKRVHRMADEWNIRCPRSCSPTSVEAGTPSLLTAHETFHVSWLV